MRRAARRLHRRPPMRPPPAPRPECRRNCTRIVSISHIIWIMHALYGLYMRCMDYACVVLTTPSSVCIIHAMYGLRRRCMDYACIVLMTPSSEAPARSRARVPRVVRVIILCMHYTCIIYALYGYHT